MLVCLTANKLCSTFNLINNFGGEMKLINICAALTFLMLLASCGSSSDPEVESLIEYLQTGSEAMSAKDSKCYAKGVKKGLTV